MAGTKNNTITYTFEGNTVDLEQAIDRLSARFKKLHKNQKEASLINYEWEGTTKSLYEAYEQIGKSIRGVRRRLKEGQGMLTDQDKEDLKNLRQIRKGIEKDLYNADTLDAKGIEQLQKNIKKGLRIAHRLRKRAMEVESKYQLKQQAKEEKVQASLSPTEQAAAGLNIENFERLKGYANLEDPAEKAFIEEMQAKVDAYKKSLKELNEEKERQAGLTERTEADTNKLTEAEKNLAQATYNLNNAYKAGINNLRKMAKLRQEKTGRNIFKDFGKKLYSQSLRQLASSIISTVIQGVKTAFGEIAKIFQPFNKAISELTSSIKYLFNSLAAMIAPIIQMVGPMLTYLTKVVARVAEMLSRLFSAMAGNDVFVKAKDQVDDYAASLNQLKKDSGLDELNKLDTQQNNFMIVDIEGLDNLKSFGKTLDMITGLITAITEPLMNVLEPVLESIAGLLANIAVVLQPIISFISIITSALGTALTTVLTPVLNFVSTMLNNLPLLIGLVASLLALWALFGWSSFIHSLGLIAFNFGKIAASIWGAITAAAGWIKKQVLLVASNIKSAVSAWIAEKAYWKLALALIAAAGMLALVVAGIVLTATSTAAAQTNSMQGTNPASVALAVGGVVTAPTLALVGEGKYDEAVVPLGQSPQFQGMKEGIAQEVVAMLGSNNRGSSGSSDRPVILNIDGKTLARALWPNLVDTQYQVGVKLK